MNRYDVIIIGAGIAGLSTASLLASRGYQVLVLEKEPIIGGRSSTFKFKGYKIDIGLHAIASLSTSGIGRLLEETAAELELVPVNPALMHIDLDSRAYMRATSAERFGQKLYQDFKGLVKVIVEMEPAEIDAYHDVSAGEWIRQNFDNPELIDFFRKITGFAGQPMEKVSAGAFIETLRDAITSKETITYPARGGIKALPDSLSQVIRRNNGEVITGISVRSLIIEDDRVKGVRAGIARPSYISEMEFSAPVVVYTAPLTSLSTILPHERIPDKMDHKIKTIKASDYNYVGIVIGARSSIMDGFRGQFFQWTFDRPGMDWHGIVTIPTFVDPQLAPDGHHLLFIDCHDPMPFGRADLARKRQEELIDICREIWVEFDRQLDWLQYVVYPGILPLARTGLTGSQRPGFHVPGTRGLYLAGDATYLTGSGIGSATKSAWACVKEIEQEKNA